MGGGFSSNRVQFHCDLLISNGIDQALYSGFTDDKKSPSDIGILAYQNATILTEYAGTFIKKSINWSKDGFGSGNFMDGRIFIGSWVDNQPTIGLEYLGRDSQIRYWGHFKDLQRDGIGLEVNFESNETYEGMWSCGNRFGEGIIGQLIENPSQQAVYSLAEFPITRLTFITAAADGESPRAAPPPTNFRDDVLVHQSLLSKAVDTARAARASARRALRAKAAAQNLRADYREASAAAGSAISTSAIKKLWARLHTRWQRELQPQLTNAIYDGVADPTEAALAARELPGSATWAPVVATTPTPNRVASAASSTLRSSSTG